MKDRETVIEALQYMISENCTEPQFDYTDDIEAAIALLKEQEQKETPTTMERINVVKVDGNDFYKGFCPACKTLQYGIKSKYCDQCGQAVKWE